MFYSKLMLVAQKTWLDAYVMVIFLKYFSFHKYSLKNNQKIVNVLKQCPQFILGAQLQVCFKFEDRFAGQG